MFKRTWLILILAGPIAMACLPPDDGTSAGSGGGVAGDGDGDGFTVEAGDCDDQRADVHPGAEEVCDQVDNNCNGRTDEGMLTMAKTAAGSSFFQYNGHEWPIEPQALATCDQGPGSCGELHGYLGLVVKKGVTQVVIDEPDRAGLFYYLLTPAGHLRKLYIAGGTSSSGRKTYEFETDDQGRLAAHSYTTNRSPQGHNHTADFNYDDVGRFVETQVTGWRGTWVQKELAYDEQGRLHQWRTYSQNGDGDVSLNSGADYTYGNNEIGPFTNIQGITRDGAIWRHDCYQFDESHRLVESRQASCDAREDAHPTTIKSVTYNESGQLIQHGRYGFSYDQNDNVIERHDTVGTNAMVRFRFACAGQPSVLDEATPHNPLEE